MVYDQSTHLFLQISAQFLIKRNKAKIGLTLTSMYGISASHNSTARGCTNWQCVVTVQNNSAICQIINIRSWNLV